MLLRYNAYYLHRHQSYSNAGSALVSLGRFEEAFARYEKALQIAPTNSHVKNALFNACARGMDAVYSKQNYKEAVKWGRRLVKYADKDYLASALDNLGNALEASGEIDEAIDMYKKSLKHDKSELRYNAYNGLCRIYFKRVRVVWRLSACLRP